MMPTYVNELDIPMRVKNALADNGYNLIDKVKQATDGQLCRIPNLGIKGVRDLRHAISTVEPTVKPTVHLSLEPIAKALARADAMDFEEFKSGYLRDAKTAVLAMRDMTDGMMNFEKFIWQDRIDAILNDLTSSGT